MTERKNRKKVTKKENKITTVNSIFNNEEEVKEDSENFEEIIDKLSEYLSKRF